MKKVSEKEKKEYIIEYDMFFMNFFAILLAIVFIFLTILLSYFNICKLDAEFFDDIGSMLFVIAMIAWMVLHEIIHGIAYRCGGAKEEDIVFGAAIEKGVFYCKAKKYINKKCIIQSLLSPLIIIGIITYIIGIIISNSWLIGLSIANISGAAGDIVMFLFFMRQEDDVLFRELGFSSPAVVKTSEDITKNKYLGVKNIREVTDIAEITEGPEKKISISKPSWIFLIFIIVIAVLDLVRMFL